MITRSNNLWRSFDWGLVIVSLLLTIFGVLMIRSATLDAIDPDLINRVPDQIRYGFLSFIVLFGLAALDYRLLGAVNGYLYLLMLLLLVLVFFFGVEGDGGSQSWLNIGIRIQPSEIAKILVIVTLAYFLARNYERISSLWTIVLSVIHLGVPAALILIQPDLGMAIVFGVMWFTMVWASGLKLKHIAIGLLILVVVTPVVVPLVWERMELYQRSRITSFIFPESDRDAFYNIRQAEASIGSAGWLGAGYAQGPQNTGRYLRVRHTDFIFAVIVEEFGFVGGTLTIIGIGYVLMRIFRAARLASDPFGSLICYGVGGVHLFSDIRFDRHELAPDAGDRLDAAVHQLGRDVATLNASRYWHGAKRADARAAYVRLSRNPFQ